MAANHLQAKYNTTHNHVATWNTAKQIWMDVQTDKTQNVAFIA